MKQGQFPAVLPLASLDGQIGFKIDGEAAHDDSGNSVSGIGDINCDGYADLLIGAEQYNFATGVSGQGRSYVIFGGPTIGQNGLLSLSSLNGANGFKLDGEASSDRSGVIVGPANDINGDGIPDFLIGAMNHNAGAGRAYVIFGGAEIGRSGLLPLSSLNGTNGFKLDGENTNSYCGSAVSGMSDMNGDGYTDFAIGAFGYNNGLGRVYVVFGGPGVGSNGLISLSTLNGTTGFKVDRACPN